MWEETSLRVGAGRPRILVIFVVLAVVATSPVPASGSGTLDRESWRTAEGLLPPEILEHYKAGEFANPIVEWREGYRHGGDDFRDGTRANAGRFVLDVKGTIVERATGRQPDYVIGLPFPEVDREDPQAALKILWNYYYQWWYNGNSNSLTELQWVNPDGIDREMIQEVRYLYYDAQPRELSPAQNPHNLLAQFLAKAVSPADLSGTSALAWRFRDGDKQDLMWAYVPALRRTRHVNASNRSDGFMGSDLSQDDGPFFDGKPEDFTWKLAGEAEMFRLVDPYSLRGDLTFRSQDGGWYVLRNDAPLLGHDVPTWKGLAWAPVSLALVKRNMWVIEGTPNDRYYLFGRIQLIIEKDTFEGAWNRKFDWKGELENIFINGRGVHNTPDGHTYVNAGPNSLILSESVRMRRATVAGPPADKETPFSIFRVKLAPELFDQEALLRGGK